MIRTVQFFTVELGRSQYDRELWRFHAYVDEWSGAIVLKLSSFEHQIRSTPRKAWTVARWWVAARENSIGSKVSRCKKPVINDGIKALALQMLNKRVSWK